MKLSKVISCITKNAINTATGGITSVLLLVSTASFAEDIDLYTSDSITGNKTRPKVLLIFDNSATMTDPEEFKPAFDNALSYGVSSDDAKYIYYAKGNSANDIPVLGANETRRFLVDINACKTAKTALDTYGRYTGRVREYVYSGNTGAWESIPELDGTKIRVIDCEDDTSLAAATDNNNQKLWKVSEDGTNTQSLPNNQAGYPIDNKGSIASPQLHTADASDSDVNWSGNYVTLYSAKYLGWHHDDTLTKVDRPRLEVARESVTTLIDTNRNIDFGLMVFNENRVEYIGDGVDHGSYDAPDGETDYEDKFVYHGGRVVHEIDTSDDVKRQQLIDMINNDVSGDTATPLCETLYEASRYLGGLSVDLGNKDLAAGELNGDYKGNTGLWEGDTYSGTPSTDLDVQTGSGDSATYISPFDSCSGKIYIIYLTDGAPWFDENMNTEVIARSNSAITDTRVEAVLADDADDATKEAFNLNTFKYDDETNARSGWSLLPALAYWMDNNDLNPNQEGIQTASTYTIGFGKKVGTGKELLDETAKRGGGTYFFADDASSLTTALGNVLSDITPSNETITSASVAANNFDKTQTLDYVYYAMFQPSSGARWQGNLKKYKIADGVIKGKNDVEAINSSGHFSTDVQSYWSTGLDGKEVSQGGAAETVQADTNRKLKIALNAGETFEDLTFANAKLWFSGDDQSTQLATELGVTDDQDVIKESLAWINGIDVDREAEDGDGGTTFIRSDVFGDPIHSQPTVINYGDNNIYVAVGTNHGVLHFLYDKDSKDNSNEISETWAFMPQEFLGNIEKLRQGSRDKVYGIDGSITKYFDDVNGDGIVNGDDKVWLFFGLRRGGKSYYALDVTTPTAPSLKWKISADDIGFSKLDYTWSQPKVIFTELNMSGGDTSQPKPTLVFGGGYNEGKDVSGVGAVDTVGNAIYMVDAATGALVWTLAADGDTTFSGVDSIPSSIGTLDSDSDGFVDRLYAGDTGGNIWRIDIPSEHKTDISVFKLASLGSDSDDADDRRFFNEPDIVRTYITETTEVTIGSQTTLVQEEVPYDAILIGSGDRTSPLDVATNDRLFMIKDSNIRTQQFSDEDLDDSIIDPPAPITINQLEDYTDNPYKNYTGDTGALTAAQKETQREALKVALKDNSVFGWFMKLAQAGEKSTAKSIVINNTAYFTTYTPPSNTASVNSCEIPSGQGWLYALDLALGIKKYSWDSDAAVNREDRIKFISEQFLGTPSLVVIPVTDADGNTELDASLAVGREVLDIDFTPQTIRTYLSVAED